MKTSESQEELIGSGNLRGRKSLAVETVDQSYSLTPVEKRFLLLAERGDCASVKRLLEDYKGKTDILDINCVDPLNRSALISAIENENIELIRILLEHNIKVKDALLHAIKEEYVEAVEILLEWEEQIHIVGEPYSWESVDRSSSNFTTDITPLILAAHMNNYEILKILLDRGATLPIPHDIRCGCDECVASRGTDSLRHSQARINAYRALAAPSLIALSSRDPVLTAFQLSWELRRMSRMETEFRADYKELREQCQTFATSLLDHVRTSNELEIMLNYEPEAGPLDAWQPGDRQTLERLKLAIKYKQKMFVAHPNVQQLLAAIWYEGLPGFRRKGMVQQVMEVAKLGAMFPVYTVIYILAPTTPMGLFMKKPFVKFICHSASYGFFLMLLGMASQRIETLMIEWFGPDWMIEMVTEWKRKERGSMPGLVESVIILYIICLIWNEVRALWSEGILEYMGDLWNIVDFITNMFYCTWIAMRISAWYIVQRESSYGIDPYYPREEWDMLDPMLISEGAFAAGMIFSFLKLVHIFSVNPHLGPLQISLGRMIIDIIKFFFIYTLVLFAFGCGLNQLMWYYADLEKSKCYHASTLSADWDHEERSCTIWRRFSNLFETSQTLFWAGFGLVDLMNFELTGIKGFTRFWGLLVFGSYSVINIIVLLNMLIAMMSNSYQIISERSDVEWKFARSKLWMSYFDDDDTVPAPFNLLPTTTSIMKFFKCKTGLQPSSSLMRKSRGIARERHEGVMRLLVRRYVMAEQRKRDEVGVTEDDVMEIRQDISTLRFELIDILRNNGMKTPLIDPKESSVAGKKGRVMERRILKDFQIGFVEGILNEAMKSEKGSKDVFTKLAKAIGKRTSSKKNKKDWNALVRSGTVVRDPIGTASEAAAKRTSRQSVRRYIIENQGAGINALDPEKLVEYNPRLSTVSPATRVAYAKFKLTKIKTEYTEREAKGGSETSSINEVDDSNSQSDPNEYQGHQVHQMDVEVEKTEFRSPTPIQEDPREEMQSPTRMDPTIDPQAPEPAEPEEEPTAGPVASDTLPIPFPETKIIISEDEPSQEPTPSPPVDSPPPATPSHPSAPKSPKAAPGNWL